jgi:thiamine-monophosphate kinase
MPATLGDLGERRIVSEIVKLYCQVAGDDCAALPVEQGQLVCTTDPVPNPAAAVIAGDTDPYWTGWLLVAINASDLAAAGAAPLAFMAAIEIPSSTLLADFERLLEGIADACKAEGLPYVGGNLKESNDLRATGIALGHRGAQRTLSRSGASCDEVLVSVGPGGLFWHDVFALRQHGTEPDRELSPLFRPRSQLGTMAELAEDGLVTSAMDNSDGLLPTLQQLAMASGVTLSLDLDSLPSPERGEPLAVDSARLWLGWGDWNVIATVAPQDLSAAKKIAQERGSCILEIGAVGPGPPGVRLLRNNVVAPCPRLESERFAEDSWFAHGIEGYVKALLDLPLP